MRPATDEHPRDHTNAVPADSGRAIRVMHVVDVLALAGLEYGVIKQVNRLDPARFAPSICALRHQSAETRAVLSPRIPVHEIHHTPGERWRLIARLAALFRRERADVAHSHNWPTYYPTVLAARLAGVPIVVHGEHGRETAAMSHERLLVKRILAIGVDRFVAVAADIARDLTETWRLPLERVRPIPNGVDLARFRGDESDPLLPGEFGFPPGARVVITIGGIRPVKDHATLLRAFAAVAAREPMARLLVVGTDYGRGLQAELVRMAATLGVADEVHFAGIRNDTPRLLALATVYVNTSVYEGMSNAILEAMAAGRPVIATSVGGSGELVVDGVTGFLVPPGDAEAVAARLATVLGDPSLDRRLGDAGRSRAVRRHRMERMIEEYENLYSDLWTRRRDRAARRGPSVSRRIAARAAAASWALSGGARRRGPRLGVLRYRRILPVAQALAYPFPSSVTPRDVFERQIARLSRKYAVLSVEEAVRRLREGTLPPRAVAIALEEGYRDAYEEAWPLLRRYGIPATIFLSPELLDRTPGTGVEGGAGPMLAWEDARDMVREGIACGAHAPAGASGGRSGTDAALEAARNAARLSEALRVPVRWLSWPGIGPGEGTHAPLARAGIEAVLTGTHGLNDADTPLHALRTLEASAFGGGIGFDAALFDAAIAGLALPESSAPPRGDAGSIA